jgi:hypothetical protein
MKLLEDISTGILTSTLIYVIVRIINIIRKKDSPAHTFNSNLKKISTKLVAYIEHYSNATNMVSTFPISVEFDIVNQYVPLNAVEYNFKSGERLPSFKNHDNVEDYILNNLKNSPLVQCFILGDFGSGKSTLAVWLAYNIAKKYIKKEVPFLPLLIPMRHINDDDIIEGSAKYLRERCNFNECSRNSIADAIRTGKVVLIFDGLDNT